VVQLRFLSGAVRFAICIEKPTTTLIDESPLLISVPDIYLLLGVVILRPSLEQNLAALCVATNICNNPRLLIQLLHVFFSISCQEKTKPLGSLF
jgi:hypothetical protein